MPSKNKYAVFGNPIAHSKSPFIHRQFAAHCGIDLEYCALAVPLAGFAEAVADFITAGGRGLNVTAPFKGEAFALVSGSVAQCTARARRARAVNTLSVDENGALAGDNTDGIGLVRDLCRNLGATVAGRRLLIIGAGGAVRGLLGPLLAECPTEIVIANRTATKAAVLAKEFASADAVALRGGGFEVINGSYDLVLHASAAGWHQAPPLPQQIFAPQALAYDLVYGDEETAFLRWARGAGVTRTADGTGMLVEQAAESFALWHGCHPPTADVIASIKERA